MEKLFYSIKEVSQLTNEPISTLRYWEKEFAQLRPRRNQGKTRFYSESDIQLIRQIKMLREEQHLSIEGIKQKLHHNPKELDLTEKVVNILNGVKQDLLNIRKQI